MYNVEFKSKALFYLEYYFRKYCFSKMENKIYICEVGRKSKIEN